LPADPDLTTEGSAASGASEAATTSATELSQDRYTNFKLHSYYRSSSSWRVRVALESKSIPYATIPVNLLESEQTSASHAELNPMLQVPVLECTDTSTGRAARITQSLAIIDFLEEIFPSRGGSLLPRGAGASDPALRAAIREMAEVINSGIQPMQNLSTFRQIDADSGGAMNGKDFAKGGIEKGLGAAEKLAVISRKKDAARAGAAGPFVMGTFAPTLADACVVPQLYNARRFGVDVDELCPNLIEAERASLDHPWFVRSHPDRQPDAPPTDNNNAAAAATTAAVAAKRNGDKGECERGASAGDDEEQEKKKARAE